MNRHGPLYCNLCSFGKSSPKIRKKLVRQEFEKSLTPLKQANVLISLHTIQIAFPFSFLLLLFIGIPILYLSL